MSQGKLRPGTKRVSYIEDIPTYKALDILAAAKDANLSSLVREATAEYLVKNDPGGELRKIAKNITAALPDEKEARPGETIDSEVQKDLARVLARIRKT